MISIGENKAVICKGDFHPAALYKGDKKIAGYTTTEFSGEGGVTLENCYNDKLHNAQIYGNSVQDGTPTPDTPVEVQSVGELVTEGEYTGKYRVPIRARGKNLFDKNNVKNGFYAAQKGEAANTLMCCTNYFIPIKPNTEYTWTSFRGSLGYGTVFYDESKSSVSRQFISTLSFTTPDNVHYMKLNVYIQEKETFQLVEGVSLGNYESYIEPQTFNIYLDEPLRKVGDYADCVDFGKGQIVRQVGASKLTNFTAYPNSDTPNTYWAKSTDYKTQNDYAPILTEYYPCSGLSTGYATVAKIVYNNRPSVGKFWTTSGLTGAIFISDDRFTTAEDLNSWIESNNVLFYYRLMNNVIQNIDLPELPTFKGTTIYEIDTQIAATISGKYKRTEE